MLKGGISETRIEKRIVISGDTDIDHDQVESSLISPLQQLDRKTGGNTTDFTCSHLDTPR